MVRRSEDEARNLQENVKQELQRKARQLYTELATVVQEQSARVHAAWEVVRTEAAKLGKRISPLTQ
ncbi:MAG TPA: hypothetical protein GX515_12935 [Firmicutes bacterium]|nr:hypothetical protein [Bacillota bacterium]